MKDVVLIIPAYKPDLKLITTVDDAVKNGFCKILIVDDGSGEEYNEVFTKIEENEFCTLLRHPVNKGKGAALRTAISYADENFKDCIGVITADADGQHLTKDIIAVAQKMKNTGNIVLGCRDFSSSNVPFRSRFGNRCTIAVFRLFFGMRVSDTQTGLRGFPKSFWKSLLSIKGDRYEYETNMLFFMSRNSLPFDEVKINTVYIDENSSSHFRVVRDSIRIYSLIIKYFFSSVAAMLVDNSAFFLFKQFPIATLGSIPQTFPAAFLARVISSLVNYFINAKMVFGGKVDKKTIFKYYALALIQISVSAAVVFLLELLFTVKLAILSTVLKMIVDLILFFLSFRIQHKWVFNNKEREKENEE